jgi:hypothetical protein
VSKSSNIRRSLSLLFVFAACVALASADLVVSSASSLPQNSNTTDETTRGGQMTTNSQSENTNTTRRRPRRRTRRRAAANANMDANMNMSGDMSGGQDANANMSGDTSGNANMSGDMSGNMNTGGRRRRRGRRNRATAAAADASMQDANANMSASGAGMERTDGGAQADLSGTYTGTVNYPEGGMTGTATMTITGTQFSITPEGGGSAVNGTITAVTTRGYTGATMMFGDRGAVPPTQAPPPLPAVSVRARKTGNNLWLQSVKGEKREFSFNSGGGSGRRRGRRSSAMTH